MRAFALLHVPLTLGRALLLGLGALLTVLGVLSGCASSAPATSAPGATTSAESASGESRSASRVASRLRAGVARWEGTPYRMGGTTRRGIDCSAFVQTLYRDALGVALPRTTRTQVRRGQRVSQRALRPGDLVFFRPSRKGRHVGVYVGAGEFAHASVSAGVTTSPLARDYWQDAYWTARRVLRLAPAEAAPLAETPPTAPARVPQHSPARGSERTGW